MTKSMKNLVLLAKLETVIGTDPVPTVADNAILVRSLGPQMLTAEFVERNNVRGYKGNFGMLAVGVHRSFEFEVELAGSGAAGTAPAWGPILKACGFSETIEVAVSVEYAPISTGDKTITMYSYLDGILFKMTASKGTVSFELNSKAIPIMKFKFIGEYSTPTDVTFPTGMDFDGFVQPVTVGKRNTPTFNIHGVDAVMQNFGFDMANSLVYRDLVNASGPYSADRKPSGSCKIELPSVAVSNWAEITRLGTQDALQLVHGTVAGNIIQIDMPKVQITSAPTISNDNEIAMLDLQFSVNPNTGNDEVLLTVM